MVRALLFSVLMRTMKKTGCPGQSRQYLLMDQDQKAKQNNLIYYLLILNENSYFAQAIQRDGLKAERNINIDGGCVAKMNILLGADIFLDRQDEGVYLAVREDRRLPFCITY